MTQRYPFSALTLLPPYDPPFPITECLFHHSLYIFTGMVCARNRCFQIEFSSASFNTSMHIIILIPHEFFIKISCFLKDRFPIRSVRDRIDITGFFRITESGVPDSKRRGQYICDQLPLFRQCFCRNPASCTDHVGLIVKNLYTSSYQIGVSLCMGVNTDHVLSFGSFYTDIPP